MARTTARQRYRLPMTSCASRPTASMAIPRRSARRARRTQTSRSRSSPAAADATATSAAAHGPPPAPDRQLTIGCSPTPFAARRLAQLLSASRVIVSVVRGVAHYGNRRLQTLAALARRRRRVFVRRRQLRDRRVRTNRRLLRVRVRRLLERVRKREDASFSEARAGDHQADRQPFRREAARNGYRRYPVHVERAGVFELGVARDIRLFALDRRIDRPRRAAPRRQHYDIDVLERIVDRPPQQLEPPAPAHVFGGFRAGAGLQLAPRRNHVATRRARDHLLVVRI